MAELNIRKATIADSAIILQFVKQLAIYEKALDKVEATEEKIQSSIFSPQSNCQALICELGPVHTNLITPAGAYFLRILGAESVIWLFPMNELQHEIREKYAEPLGSPLKHAIRCCSSLI